MAFIEVKAHAKLNLTLDVLGQRNDGFHNLRMVMQSVNLTDTLKVSAGVGGGTRVYTNVDFLPTNEKNLAAAAALRFQEATGRDAGGVAIHLQKSIPVCAGLGGGSADAAAVLRAMNRLLDTRLSPVELAKIGELVGSDVPFCVFEGTALAEGRGEILKPLPNLPRCNVVLCKPAFSVKTPELFHRLDRVGPKFRHRPKTDEVLAALEGGDLPGVAQRLYNVFEDVLQQRQKMEVLTIKDTLFQYGALGASMSGTGPTVFGLFQDNSAARLAWETLKGSYRNTFLVQSV